MTTRIALVCPGKPILRERAGRVIALAEAEFPDVELRFDEQCFLETGHFAGKDSERFAAFVTAAEDPDIDAVWFAMGGYGANRIAGPVVQVLGDAARSKTYLGYSDTGFLLGALYRHGIGRPVHGPLAGDIRREGGEEAIRRVLRFLSGQDTPASADAAPTVAFNLTTLAMLAGTELMPDISGHVVMVEEVAEHLYAIDRLFFHVTQHLHGCAGIRLGRISEVPENDRPFGFDEVEIAQYWCERSGIPYLGRADIGHDADNAIVPFGLA